MIPALLTNAFLQNNVGLCRLQRIIAATDRYLDRDMEGEGRGKVIDVHNAAVLLRDSGRLDASPQWRMRAILHADKIKGQLARTTTPAPKG